jgi:hypothetical protein
MAASSRRVRVELHGVAAIVDTASVIAWNPIPAGAVSPAPEEE